jgi:hypothetical protein
LTCSLLLVFGSTLDKRREMKLWKRRSETINKLGHSIHVYSIYWRLNGALCYYVFNKFLLELGRGMTLHGRRANATWAQELPTSRYACATKLLNLLL